MAKFQVNDDLLISLVQINEALYDRNNTNYKDAVLKDQIWSSIAETLNLPKVVCKSRWTIIRQRYSRVKRQVNQRPKKISWKLYDSLSFLNKHILPRSFMTMEMPRQNSDQEQDKKPPKPPITSTISYSPCKFTSEVKFQVPVTLSPPVTYSSSPPSVPRVSPNVTPPTTPSSIMSTTRLYSKNQIDKTVETDDIFDNNDSGSLKQSDVSFGDFIVSELASFKNEHNKDKAKQSIVNVIYKYKNQLFNVHD